MDTSRFDSLTKDLASSTTRRHALAGLGALALGGAGIVSLSRATAAADVSDEEGRRRCIDRCNDRGGNNNQRQRRKRCRRKCENR
jgi:hypothetical protein